MRLHDPLDQAQPESGALNLRRDDVGRAVERLEDRSLIGRGDADAAIATVTTHFAALTAGVDAESSRRRRRT